MGLVVGVCGRGARKEGDSEAEQRVHILDESRSDTDCQRWAHGSWQTGRGRQRGPCAVDRDGARMGERRGSR